MTSRARSFVEASTTGAATPSSYACRHRAATTHQRSPGCRPGEAPLGPRCGQVVADRALVLQELGGHHRADRVQADVLGTAARSCRRGRSRSPGRCRTARGRRPARSRARSWDEPATSRAPTTCRCWDVASPTWTCATPTPSPSTSWRCTACRAGRVAYDSAKRRAGVCRFATQTLGLSAPLTTLHSEVEVRDTILHEIAHALVGPRHGHDRPGAYGGRHRLLGGPVRRDRLPAGRGGVARASAPPATPSTATGAPSG